MTNEKPVDLVEAEKMLRGAAMEKASKGAGLRNRSILVAFRSSSDVPRRLSVLGLVGR